MKFFVDTADVAEIADLAATGLLDGVTTNPSLIAKSGRDFFDRKSMTNAEIRKYLSFYFNLISMCYFNR